MHIHTLKYTNKQRLRGKGVGTAFPRVPTEKTLMLPGMFSAASMVELYLKIDE